MSLNARIAWGLCSDIHSFPLSPRGSCGVDVDLRLRTGTSGLGQPGNHILWLVQGQPPDWPISIKETQLQLLGKMILSCCVKAEGELKLGLLWHLVPARGRPLRTELIHQKAKPRQRN